MKKVISQLINLRLALAVVGTIALAVGFNNCGGRGVDFSQTSGLNKQSCEPALKISAFAEVPGLYESVSAKQSSNVNYSHAEGEDGEDKVTICHVPPGNPDARHTITIGRPALSAHLKHSSHTDENDHDYIGSCENPEDPDDTLPSGTCVCDADSGQCYGDCDGTDDDSSSDGQSDDDDSSSDDNSSEDGKSHDDASSDDNSMDEDDSVSDDADDVASDDDDASSDDTSDDIPDDGVGGLPVDDSDVPETNGTDGNDLVTCQ